jgi:hypothetical protein
MSVTDTVVKPVSHPQRDRDSSGDINRRSDDSWHLDSPHKKALTALFYTSLLRGAWAAAAHCSGILFHFSRFKSSGIARAAETDPMSGV